MPASAFYAKLKGNPGHMMTAEVPMRSMDIPRVVDEIVRGSSEIVSAMAVVVFCSCVRLGRRVVIAVQLPGTSLETNQESIR